MITLFGKDLATARRRDLPALRRRIGVVFQDFRLLDHLSAFDNVALPLRLAGKRGHDYSHDVEECARLGGIGRPHGRAAQEPCPAASNSVWPSHVPWWQRAGLTFIADEPTGNVDPEIGARLIRLFSELNRLGTTVLIATHDRALIETARAREMRLVDGRLVELRNPQVIPPQNPPAQNLSGLPS